MTLAWVLALVGWFRATAREKPRLRVLATSLRPRAVAVHGQTGTNDWDKIRPLGRVLQGF